jgi:TIR domain-containing protein
LSASPTVSHAFISYVHENDEQVDSLCSFLEAAGISVWRDRNELWPGDDWKIQIRRAIQRGALAFIVCFSEESMTKVRSYQNEELNLAIEEYRLRPPGNPWIFPVRFGDVSLPEYELAPGKTLASLQWTDLFGSKRDPGLARLIVSISRVIGSPLTAPAHTDDSSQEVAAEIASGKTASPEGGEPEKLSAARHDRHGISYVKSLLRDSARDIELDDFITELADAARQKCLDSATFPTSSDELRSIPSAAEYIIERVEQYWQIVRPLSESFATGCAWGAKEHEALWSRAIKTISNTTPMEGGNTLLLNIRAYPRIITMYAASLGAVSRKNYSALRAITVDAKYRENGRIIPVIDANYIHKPFSAAPEFATVLAWHTAGEDFDGSKIIRLQQRGGNRITPVSDDLHLRLRSALKPLIRDDEQFDEQFDEMEIMLGRVAADAATLVAEENKIYVPGGWVGRYVWHDRTRFEELRNQLNSEQGAWVPLQSGLFGSSVDRATKAFAAMSEIIGRTNTF